MNTTQASSSSDLENLSPDTKQASALHFTTFIHPQTILTSGDPASKDRISNFPSETIWNTRDFGADIDNAIHQSTLSASSSYPLSIDQHRLATKSAIPLPDIQPFSPAFAVSHQTPYLQSSSSFGAHSPLIYQSMYSHATATPHAAPSTPLGQMLHTPSEPPEVRRYDRLSGSEAHTLNLTTSPCDHILETYQSSSESNQTAVEPPTQSQDMHDMPFYRTSSDISTVIRSDSSGLHTQSAHSMPSSLFFNDSIPSIEYEWHSSNEDPRLEFHSPPSLTSEIANFSSSGRSNDVTVKREFEA